MTDGSGINMNSKYIDTFTKTTFYNIFLNKEYINFILSLATMTSRQYPFFFDNCSPTRQSTVIFFLLKATQYNYDNAGRVFMETHLIRI